MINYDSASALRTFLDERGLGMRKQFGQNFLVNPHARLRLLDALELPEGAEVWEIGPGLGAMTSGLLERGGRVSAFEIDPAFVKALRDLYGENPSLRVIEGDVLKTWPELRPLVPEEELFLFGNLPYNIGAALIADFIEKRRFFKRMVVTVQREVALRMAAGPGSADYSSFSVLCSSVYKLKLLQVIKGSSFYPAPRVDSQGVRLDLDTGRKELPELFYPLVRSLFSSRRKTVRNTLSAFALQVIINGRAADVEAELRGFRSGREKEARSAAEEVLRRAGVSGDRRPETLGIDEFAALAAFMGELGSVEKQR